MDDGKPRWQFQALADDVWNGACQLAGPNCPANPGPDWDIGASVVLSTSPGGRDTLLAGQKSGELFALDPTPGARCCGASASARHTERRQQRHPLGMASDGVHVFAPVSDPQRDDLPGYTPRPGVYACASPTAACCGSTRSRAAARSIRPTCRSPGWPRCARAQRAPRAHRGQRAPSSTRNRGRGAGQRVVYAGALDGRLRALDAATGRELRTFETARAFHGVNGLDGHGGSIDVGGVLPHGRFLFVVSGYGMFRQMPGNVLLAYALPQTPAYAGLP